MTENSNSAGGNADITSIEHTKGTKKVQFRTVKQPEISCESIQEQALHAVDFVMIIKQNRTSAGKEQSEEGESFSESDQAGRGKAERVTDKEGSQYKKCHNWEFDPASAEVVEL
ncbi:hypothetical protein INR49_028940 [Caranx melampygus]|nr:hypothetical protein INR49_028940 [Caranx melampygus]